MLGSMMHEGKPEGANGGGLHCVEVGEGNKLTVSLKLDDVTIANGMGWTRDNKTMWVEVDLTIP
jgi:sugar lactone lactonase YvrE